MDKTTIAETAVGSSCHVSTLIESGHNNPQQKYSMKQRSTCVSARLRHARAHVHTHARLHLYVPSTNLYRHIHIYIWICMCIYTQAHRHPHIHVYMYTHISHVHTGMCEISLCRDMYTHAFACACARAIFTPACACKKITTII